MRPAALERFETETPDAAGGRAARKRREVYIGEEKRVTDASASGAPR